LAILDGGPSLQGRQLGSIELKAIRERWHFSQGDGEITFCGAIEMGGFMDLQVDLIKGGMAAYGVGENAIFMPGIRDPQYSEWIAFSGVSVDFAGKQHYLDSQLAYARACNHAIDYLMKFGYTDIQAYMILGSAPVEGRFSGVVDIPNSCATATSPERSSTSTSARLRAGSRTK
jgi:formamidase